MQRHRANPIIRPGKGQWDHDAVYKRCAIFDGKQRLLWYNGRKGGVEQIGLALHQGEDLGSSSLFLAEPTGTQSSMRDWRSMSSHLFVPGGAAIGVKLQIW